MKPSDFQKTVQCRFECCLKKIVRSIVCIKSFKNA